MQIAFKENVSNVDTMIIVLDIDPKEEKTLEIKQRR